MSGCGDGDRAAAGDLLAEDRHHAAGRVEHVAEAHGDEAARRAARPATARTARPRRLQAAHHAGGIDGLVGRDHHERLDAVLVGQVGQVAGGQHDVLDRLAGVGFHQRHVLVGGGVEDDVGPVLRRDTRRIRRCVEHVGDADVDLRAGGQRLQFAFQEELAGLRAVDQHQIRAARTAATGGRSPSRCCRRCR